uniref:Protein phosphatase 1 regulatory subunit 26 N-terminal domain-containing protein n=1 Tax=Callorhinchus milii TaxID=7868 RepID=A0A4W3GUV8_CALMI
LFPPHSPELQKDWQPFGPPRSFSFPVSFSESEEEFSSISSAVNVNVQMIIENLKPDDSPRAMNHERSDGVQTNAAGKRRSEGTLDDVAIKVLKGTAVEDVKSGFPSYALGAEGSSLGHYILDSDSDESIDRDIEEAIQEYLKKKTEDNHLISKAANETKTALGTHPDNKDSIPHSGDGITPTEEVSSVKLEHSFGNTESHEVDLDAAVSSRCSSPSSSVSSNDSFELSIQAEIERFLQDKREKETIKVDDNKLTHSLEADTISWQKKVGEGNQGSVNNLKKPIGAHSCKNSNESSCDDKQTIKSEYSDLKPKPIIAVAELSDSSSDDGIEEAIQLYQLEQKKGKAEDVLGLLSPKTPNAQKSADPVSPCRMKSPEKEKLQMPIKKKEKLYTSKSGEFKMSYSSNLSDSDSTDQSSDEVATQIEITNMDSELRQKKIIQTESQFSSPRERTLISQAHSATSMHFANNPLSLKKEHHKSSSKAFIQCFGANMFSSSESSVDSSDSVEKEIQSYLAFKANLTSQKTNAFSPMDEQHCSLSPALKKEDSLNGSSSLSSASVSELSQFSLLHKRTLKYSIVTVNKRSEEELNKSQVKESSKTPDVLVDKMAITYKVTNYDGESKQSDSWQTDEKSSSIDSDEDLDTATMDLLKTRKKLGKRLKDTKSRCKKKVRFTGAEVRTYSQQSTSTIDGMFKTSGQLHQGEGLISSHGPLKSCLSKSSKSAPKSYLEMKNKGTKKAAVHLRSENNRKVSTPLGKERIGKSNVGSSYALQKVVTEKPTGGGVVVDDSSSVDSDDGIEQEILRFLAEKAKVSTQEMEERRKDELKTNSLQSSQVQGENSKWSVKEEVLPKLPMQDIEKTCTSHQIEGFHSGQYNVGPYNVERTVSGNWSQGTQGFVDSKEDDIADIGQVSFGSKSTPHQTKHTKDIKESPAVSRIEIKTEIVKKHLQITGTNSQERDPRSSCSGQDNNPAGYRWASNPPEGCRIQKFQINHSVLHLETMSDRFSTLEQRDLSLENKREQQQNTIKVVSSEETASKFKLPTTFKTKPHEETVEVDCGLAEYSGSIIKSEPDQSPSSSPHTEFSAVWDADGSTKCEANGVSDKDASGISQPIGNLILRSPHADCITAKGSSWFERQEQSDHNYQGEEKYTIRLKESNMEQHVSEGHSDSLMQGLQQTLDSANLRPLSHTSVTNQTELPVHKECDGIEKGVHSVGPEEGSLCAQPCLETKRISEGAYQGKVTSQYMNKQNYTALSVLQICAVSLASSGNSTQEEKIGADRTQEKGEAKSQEDFFDETNIESGEDTGGFGRSVVERAGSEV